MQLKSYFSGSVEAAMELARKELGDDALLVNARPSTLETRYLGAYEVVFGLAPRAGATFAPAPSASPTLAVANTVPTTQMKTLAAAAGAGVAGQMNFTQPRSSTPQTRSSSTSLPLENLRGPSTTKSSEPATAPAPAELRSAGKQAAGREVLSNTVNDEHFRQNLNQLRQQIGQLTASVRPLPAPLPTIRAQDTESAAAALHLTAVATTALPTEDVPRSEEQPSAPVRPARKRLRPNISTDPSLGRPAGLCSIVALVGPPGSGKTTTLVKLAIRYGLACRRSVHILTTDVHRIAAADQLRSLAAILGVGCDVIENETGLERALDQHREKSLILIDTPGLGLRDVEEAGELARMLSDCRGIDTHLVLPASMKHSDMTRVAKQYAAFAPKKLLFTRMDETSHVGGLLRLAAEQQLPISFLSNGQEIPDDLQEANVAELLELLPFSRSLGTQVASRYGRPIRANRKPAVPPHDAALSRRPPASAAPASVATNQDPSDRAGQRTPATGKRFAAARVDRFPAHAAMGVSA